MTLGTTKYGWAESLLRTWKDEMSRQHLPYPHATKDCEWHSNGFHTGGWPVAIDTTSFHVEARRELKDLRDEKLKQLDRKGKIWRKVYQRAQVDRSYMQDTTSRYMRMMGNVHSTSRLAETHSEGFGMKNRADSPPPRGARGLRSSASQPALSRRPASVNPTQRRPDRLTG